MTASCDCVTQTLKAASGPSATRRGSWAGRLSIGGKTAAGLSGDRRPIHRGAPVGRVRPHAASCDCVTQTLKAASGPPATEDRDVAKAGAEEGLIDGVVGAVVGWLNETSDGRTVYNVTMIGLTAARGIARRTAFGAYDVADINRALDASKAAQL